MTTIKRQLEPGLNDLIQSIENVSLQDRETRSFLKKALRPAAKTARRLVPPPGYPGDKPDLKPLRKTITVQSRTLRTATTWYGLFGPSYPSGAHGHLVEFGTKPHPVNHPGAAAKPYMVTAWKKHKAEVLAALQDYVGRELVESAKHG